MRTLIRFSLKRPGFVKSKKTETLLGYSIPSLATHLRRTVPPGYTWNDFLSGELQIDHRKPLASFAITGEDCPAFREAWAMSNLCLLPGIPNRKKGARLLAA